MGSPPSDQNILPCHPFALPLPPEEVNRGFHTHIVAPDHHGLVLDGIMLLLKHFVDEALGCDRLALAAWS